MKETSPIAQICATNPEDVANEVLVHAMLDHQDCSFLIEEVATIFVEPVKLQQLSTHIATYHDLKVTLLIEDNCSLQLMSKEEWGERSKLIAQRTKLGWSKGYGDVTVGRLTPESKPTVKLKGEVHNVCKSQSDGCVLKQRSKFNETIGEEAMILQESSFSTKLMYGLKHVFYCFQVPNTCMNVQSSPTLWWESSVELRCL